MNKILGIKSGTFTLLTKGHVNCLEFCKRYCNYLIVVINGDNYLQEKKGFLAVPVEQRVEVVKAIKWVDEVCVYHDPHEHGIIKALWDKRKEVYDKLTVFHAAETHEKDFIPGEGIADRLVFCPSFNSLSTTDIMKRIRWKIKIKGINE